MIIYFLRGNGFLRLVQIMINDKVHPIIVGAQSESPLKFYCQIPSIPPEFSLSNCKFVLCQY